MKFLDTPLEGGHLVQLEERSDDRGFFARLYCEQEFARAGLSSHFVQVNNAFSRTKGTLRGMHYQIGDGAETKLVRCLRGAAWDVILDLRPQSQTFGQSFGAEINEDNRLMMYVPKGFAHGIQTLTGDTEILYFVSNFYAPDKERGVRWNDPRFGIEWPIAPSEISTKDAAWPNFDPAYHLDPAPR